MPALGLTHAVAEGSDPTFTKLTGPDTLALLDNLVDAKSPLDAESRSFILGLMRAVRGRPALGRRRRRRPGHDVRQQERLAVHRQRQRTG